MAKRKAGNGTARARVSAEAFVKAWAKGGTVADVAGRLGCDARSVTSRGIRYRKAGIALPKLERRGGGPRLDVDALNELLK